MKMNKTIFGIMTILIFVLSSCSNSIEEKDSLKKNNLATLKICLNNNSRTVFPDTNLEELTNFEFQGMNGDYQEIRRSYSSILDLRNDEIKLETGEWNFTIFARKGDACYTATKNQNIVQGENNLFFELEIYESRYGNGSFSITLNFSETENSDKVTSATASLQNINETSVSGFGVKSLSVNNGKVTYSENQIKTGSYRILITLYYGSQELLTWREIVVISNGLISSAERKLDSVNLYKITYELNDDENNSANFTDSALETYNRYSVVRTLPQVTRQYYTFEGWHLKEDLSDEVITKLPSSVNGNVSVYAKWHPLTYRINYEFNGGDNDNVTFVDYTPETNTFSLPNTKKTGYKFCGWYDTADFSGDAVSQIKKGSGGNKTLYAKWCLADISIIYELNDNEEYPASFVGEKLDKYNYETEARTLPTLSRPCYDFEGWHLKEDLTDVQITEIPNIDGEEIKLFAKWKLHEFSINYNLNGGELDDGPTHYNITNYILLPIPYKTGYDFCGWYVNGNTIEKCAEIPVKSFEDKYLTAEWRLHEYSITYELNGGAFEEEYIESFSIISDSIILKHPVKEGFLFEGWYKEYDFSGNCVLEIEKCTHENISLYAKWRYEPYSITYELDGGEFFVQQENTYRQCFDCKTVIPYDKRRVFQGWYLSPDLKGDPIETLNGFYDRDVILYASWKEPAIGDVVVENGWIIKIEEYNSSFGTAIAVLFKVDNELRGLGIYNSGNTKYAMCNSTSHSFYTRSTYSSKIGVKVGYSGYPGAYSNVPLKIDYVREDVDGSDNLICENEDELHFFPMIGYLNNYKNNFLEPYKEGWYIPSGYELWQIFLARKELNNSLSKINGNVLINDYYWSSSELSAVIGQYETYAPSQNAGFTLNLGTGCCGWGNLAYKNNGYSVCCIRKIDSN